MEKIFNVKTELQELSNDEIIQEYYSHMYPEKVCCLNLGGDINIGQIIRTASLFAMSEVIIAGRRSFDKRTCVGMDHYIPVRKIRATTGNHNEELSNGDVLTILEELSQTHSIVFIEQSSKSIPLNKLHQLVFSDKLPVFVLGTEKDGIPTEILEYQPSVCIHIPQRGIGRSYNVSNAFAMVAWEYYSKSF